MTGLALSIMAVQAGVPLAHAGAATTITAASVQATIDSTSPLSQPEKDWLSAKARTVNPEIPQSVLDAIFAQEAKGNNVPINGLPVAIGPTTVSPTPTDAAERSVTCGPQHHYFWVQMPLENNTGATVAKFQLDAEWWDNCEAIYPASTGLLYQNVPGTGAIAGWQFDNFSGVVNEYFKWGGVTNPPNPTNGYRWRAQANFHACVIQIGCYASWHPMIQIEGMADPFAPDIRWTTSKDAGWHYAYTA